MSDSRKYTRQLDKDKSDYQISEEIILGLKRKIEDRLLVSHTKPYVNEIISVVNDLIIEASYLGCNCYEKGTHQFIINAITKRRNE